MKRKTRASLPSRHGARILLRPAGSSLWAATLIATTTCYGAADVASATTPPRAAVLPIRDVAREDEHAGATPAIVRGRVVEIDRTALAGLKFDQVDHLAVALFEDVGAVLKIERETAEALGSRVLTGHVLGEARSSFTLVVYGDLLSANIRMPAKGSYQVRPLPGGLHTIRQMDERKFPSCAGTLSPPLNVARPAGGPAGRADDGTVIDVLVLYTPAARSTIGSVGAMNLEIITALAETNAVFANSGIVPRLRLVHQAQIDYVESGDYSMDLVRISTPGDGFLEAALTLRADYCADLVCLFVAPELYPTFCGRAYIMDTPGPAFESLAFSIVRADCAAGNLTFAHELGHNMGCHHDRENACSTDACTGLCCPGDPTRELELGAFDYSYGHRIPDQWRTVMAYDTGCTACPRIPYFSNPDVDYFGVPTGVPGGQPSGANNALTINNTRTIVANFRESCPGACCDLGGSCTEVSEVSCAAGGGFYQGDGTTCASTPCAIGACCDRVLYSCRNGVVFDACDRSHQEWTQGELCVDLDPACLPPVGRCCLSDGTCQVTASTTCFAMGGRPGMAGTVCAGDGSGNGTDDACEADILYYHQDATGNLMAMTDSTGQVVWRAEVHPFGQGIPMPSSHPTRFVEQERERDIGAADGLYPMGARMYDPTTGRFMNPDPLALADVRRENPARFNRYAYALNNPYRYIDPSGLEEEDALADKNKRILDDDSFPADDEDAQKLLKKVKAALNKLTKAKGRRDRWARAPKNLRKRADLLKPDWVERWKTILIKYSPTEAGASVHYNKNGQIVIQIGRFFATDQTTRTDIEKIILHEFLHKALDAPKAVHHSYIDQIIQFDLKYPGAPNPAEGIVH